jgi:hypothetical protein
MSTPPTLRNIGGPLVGTPTTVLAGLPGPTVAELAVASAGALNSLARTVPADSFRIKRALQLLHCDTPPAIRTTFRFDGAVAKQFYFLVKDTVRVITCPTQATDISNQAVCLANLGDQLDDYRPVSVSPEEFGGYVVTLVPKGTVATYGLPPFCIQPGFAAPA